MEGRFLTARRALSPSGDSGWASHVMYLENEIVQPTPKDSKKELFRKRNLTVKRTNTVKSQFRLNAESNIYLESLILAQDERWRRA